MAIDTEKLWLEFAERMQLTSTMLEQFKIYYDMLMESNELFNLTAITDFKSVIAYHFEDSLMLDGLISVNTLHSLADIGAGAGFPGIPLKIKFPHLSVTLIEVSHKKVQFLERVVQELGLEHVEVSSYDWRTFLRKTALPIDLFCARASLHTDELMRIFKPSSPYKDKKLVYWASDQWVPDPSETKYISAEFEYKIKNRRRKLVLFQNQT